MSLDISLYAQDRDGNEFEVWETNITHNLSTMAKKAGLYDVMWQPHENSIDFARGAIAPLEVGLKKLISDREELEELNPDNGWGNYDGLLNCAGEYLTKCKQYPSSRIEVSR